MRGQFDTYCNSQVSFVLDDKSHSFIDFSDWLIPVQGHMCAEACSKKKKNIRSPVHRRDCKTQRFSAAPTVWAILVEFCYKYHEMNNIMTITMSIDHFLLRSITRGALSVGTESKTETPHPVSLTLGQHW